MCMDGFCNGTQFILINKLCFDWRLAAIEIIIVGVVWYIVIELLLNRKWGCDKNGVVA